MYDDHYKETDQQDSHVDQHEQMAQASSMTNQLWLVRLEKLSHIQDKYRASLIKILSSLETL